MERLKQLIGWYIERYLTRIGAINWGKSAGDAPTPPSPQEIMASQLEGNRAQAGLDAEYNRWGESGPFGSVGWDQGFNQAQFSADKAERDRQYNALAQKREPIIRGAYDARRAKAEAKYAKKGAKFKEGTSLDAFMQKKGLDSYDSFRTKKMDKFLGAHPNKIVSDVKPGDTKYQTWTRKTELNPVLQGLLDKQLAGQSRAMDSGLQSMDRLDSTLAKPMLAFGVRELPKVMDRLDVPKADLATRQHVEDALMERLNPYLSRDEASMRQNLANQGLVPGSEAYNHAMDDLNRQRNDARLAVVGQGGQEMERQFGMDMQGFNAGLGQNSEIFGQGMQNFNAGLGQDAQLFNQDMARRNQAMGETQGLFGLSGNVPIPQSNTGQVNTNAGYDASGAAQNQLSGLMGKYNAGVAQNNANTQAAVGGGTAALTALAALLA